MEGGSGRTRIGDIDGNYNGMGLDIYVDNGAVQLGDIAGAGNPYLYLDMYSDRAIFGGTVQLDVGEQMLGSTPDGTKTIALTTDGGKAFFETWSTDGVEGLIMHGNGVSRAGIVLNMGNSYAHIPANTNSADLVIFNSYSTPETGLSGDIVFAASSTEVMRIDGTTKNIGIGTSTPIGNLHVETNAPGDMIYLGDYSDSGLISSFVINASTTVYGDSNFVALGDINNRGSGMGVVADETNETVLFGDIYNTGGPRISLEKGNNQIVMEAGGYALANWHKNGIVISHDGQTYDGFAYLEVEDADNAGFPVIQKITPYDQNTIGLVIGNKAFEDGNSYTDDNKGLLMYTMDSGESYIDGTDQFMYVRALHKSLSLVGADGIRLDYGNDGLYELALNADGFSLDTSVDDTIDLAVDVAGNVGIGTSTPGYTLHVVGSGDDVAKFENATNGTACTLSGSTGLLTCTSDARLKKDIVSIDTALQKIVQLNPSSFHWLNQTGTDAKIAGFIAQDVESIFPDLVQTDADSGYKSLSLVGMVPYLTKAIQEQQLQITALATGLGGASIFDGSFDGTLRVKKSVAFGVDTVGQAKILAGSVTSTITFIEAYEYMPIVAVTPVGSELLAYDFSFVVTDKTATGFTVQISQPQPIDITFDWHAFASEEGKLFVSDGTTEDITLVVVDEPSSVVVENGNGGGGDAGDVVEEVPPSTEPSVLEEVVEEPVQPQEEPVVEAPVEPEPVVIEEPVVVEVVEPAPEPAPEPVSEEVSVPTETPVE
jgi:hypothetical protein